MVRARKSHKRDEEITKSQGIKLPYGARPGDNTYVVYADYYRENLDTPKVLILSFAAKYAAHFFISNLIDSDEYKWVNPIGSRECIKTDTGIRISMFNHDLKGLIDYEPNELEAEWTDEKVLNHIFHFKHGKSPDEDKRQSTEPSTDKERTPKPRVPKAERVPRPTIDRTGLVSANDIALELGVEGRDVRGVLRALKLEKPAGGWLFDKKTADDIRAKVSQGLKEKKKK